MAHARNRHVQMLLGKMTSLWPIVGVVGLRQVGKSTLLRDLWGKIKEEVSLDDGEMRDAAEASPKTFLSRFQEPLLIDEVQKVPTLFDALKLSVDRVKTPGRFLLTGSIDFSTRIGIRESLTGRIGLIQLFPLTLSESLGTTFGKKRASAFHKEEVRHSPEEVSRYLKLGGLPRPMFMREDSQRNLYFQSWIETTLFRDCAKVYGRGYDPEVAYRLLENIADLHREGCITTTHELKMDTRKLKKYLLALTDVFLLNRVLCHQEGVGHDAYLFSDTGVAAYFMGGKEKSLLATQSLLRIFLVNELLALNRYQGIRYQPTYYKSKKGKPIDLVWEGCPIQIFTQTNVSQWDTRSIEGAMKKLKSIRGILVTPSSRAEVKSKGLSTVPWSFWS